MSYIVGYYYCVGLAKIVSSAWNWTFSMELDVK